MLPITATINPPLVSSWIKIHRQQFEKVLSALSVTHAKGTQLSGLVI